MNDFKFEITKSELFKHPKFGNLRVLTDENGDPWFVGKVVAEALGYVRPREALSDHVLLADRKLLRYKACAKTAQASEIWKGQDFSDKTIINESGLYSLILGSKLPAAVEFKHWVTSEVLPQIRRTGGYIPIRNARTGELLSDEELLERANEMIGRTLQELNAQSADCLTATQVARMWGMDVLSFNNLLANIGIQHRKGGRWQLAEELEGKGLAAVRYYFSYSLKGKARMRRYLVWTLEGIHFLNTAVYKVPRMLTKGVQLSFNF